MTENKTDFVRVLPVMSGFFIMGFVDMAGIATSYVKQDFGLNDTMSGLVPMLAFLWFIVFSVPTGILMGRIGRKNTALLSLLVTVAGLLIPIAVYNFSAVLVAFTLLGIGNTMSQISYNPLLTNVVAAGKLTSALTFGQFTRSIASFLGPVIVGFLASFFGDWTFVFWVYTVVTLASVAWLYFTPIPGEPEDIAPITFRSTFSLFRDGYIFACFLGILFFVGIDVGLNTYIPKYLMEKTGIMLDKAGLGTSLYFAARMIGSFAGGFLLLRLSAEDYLRWSMIVMTGVFGMILLSGNLWVLLGLIFILGFVCANVFSIVLALALKHRPERANEVSALVLMGVVGGALTTPVMGMIADYAGQTAGMAVLGICMLYILIFAYRLRAGGQAYGIQGK